MQALEYNLPPRGRRPGVLSAIGVISIVVASLSGLYSLYAGMQGFGFYMLSMMSSQRPGAPFARATVAPPAVASPQPLRDLAVVSPFGMNEAERKSAAESLVRLQPMGSRRLEQLDAILSSSGRQLGVDAVTESGLMPDARSGEKGPVFFVSRKGRLEVFDDRAVFFPADNSPTVRVSALPQKPANASDVAVEATRPGGVAATGPAMLGGLTPVEVQAVIQQAQSLAARPLNPGQVTALQVLLADPTQQYVPAGGTQGAIVASVVQPNGQATVSFSSGGMVVLGPQGNVVSQVPPMGAFMPNFQISPWAVAAYIALAVVSLGLAVLLLVAGIAAVRDSPKARRLHLIYASLKIPAAVAGGVAMGVVMYQLMSGAAAAAPGAGPAPMKAVALVTSAVPSVLGCVYPVALLIALNTKSVRDYYHSATPDPA